MESLRFIFFYCNFAAGVAAIASEEHEGPAALEVLVYERSRVWESRSPLELGVRHRGASMVIHCTSCAEVDREKIPRRRMSSAVYTDESCFSGGSEHNVASPGGRAGEVHFWRVLLCGC